MRPFEPCVASGEAGGRTRFADRRRETKLCLWRAGLVSHFSTLIVLRRREASLVFTGANTRERAFVTVFLILVSSAELPCIPALVHNLRG